MTKTTTTPLVEYTVRQAAELIFGEATDATIKAVQRMIASGTFPNAHQLPGGINLPYLIPEQNVTDYIKTADRVAREDKPPYAKKASR